MADETPQTPPPPTLNELITEWFEASKQADHWTVREKILRQQIFSHAFPAPVIGTNKIRIDHGMALIGDYRMNYRIDRPLLESMLAEPNLRPLIEQVIAYRPEVKPGEFRKLDDGDRLMIAAMITETPGTPGLEIKPQNKVRW